MSSGASKRASEQLRAAERKSERMSAVECASEQMSAAERASEVSSAERANEFAVRANEQMAQYSMRQFPFIFAV